MKKIFLKLVGGAVFLLPLMFASCGNIDNPLEILDTSGSGGGSSSSTDTSTENTYLVWDATAKQLKSEALPTTYTKMDASQTTWSGTYIVEDDVEITSDVTLSGDATIIIKDGKTLSLASDKKIEYVGATAYKLNIHAQSEGASAGKLVVSTTSANTRPIFLNGSLSIYGASVSTTATGTYSEGIFVADELNMYGGELKSTGTLAGIMVDNASGGTVNIYGGTVDATTTTDDPGPYAISIIGNMNIYNGTVKGTATAKGGGIYVAGYGMGTLTIENGTVTGKGGDSMVGINAKTITISGGTVTAENGDGGNGALQCYGDLTISGDETVVNAIGGDQNTGSASIGILAVTLTIDGGTITATGGNGTGTGSGGNGIDAPNIIVTACNNVTASGGDSYSSSRGIKGTIALTDPLKLYEGDSENPDALASSQTSSTRRYVIIK